MERLEYDLLFRWFAGLGVGGCVNFVLESRGQRAA